MGRETDTADDRLRAIAVALRYSAERTEDWTLSAALEGVADAIKSALPREGQDND
jgi:hypothetical protein